MAGSVKIGALVIDMTANLAPLKAGMAEGTGVVEKSSQKMVADAGAVAGGFKDIPPEIAGITAALAPLTASFNALAQAEQARAAATISGLQQVNGQLAITQAAANDTAGAMSGISVGDNLSKSLDGASAQFDQFAEKSKVKSIAIGLAVGALVAGTVIAPFYAAYRIINALSDTIAGMFNGDFYKSASIDALIAMNKQVKDLQDSLGLTAQQASATNAALATIGVDKSTYTSVFNNAADAIRTNTKELDRLGVAYKDAKGKLLPVGDVIANVNAELQKYTAGWDRNNAAAAIGIGTAAQVAEAAKMTKEEIAAANARLNQYNLGIGPESQAAVEQYEKTMRIFNRELDLTSQGFKRAWADQIMPVMTDLADFLKEGWPSAVNAFRIALATVTTVLYTLGTAFYTTAETVIGSVDAIGAALGGLLRAGAKALTGDLTGAKEELVKGWDGAKTSLGQTWDKIVDKAKHNAAAVKLAWAADDRAQTPADSPKGKTFTPPPKKKKDEELSDYEKLVRAINEKTAAEQFEIEVGADATEGQKLAMKTMVGIRDGTLETTEAERIQLGVMLEKYLALEKNNIALKNAAATTKDVTAQLQKYTDATTADREQMDGEAALIGKTGEARKIAAEQLKVDVQQRAFLAEELKKGHILSDQQIADLNAAAAARKENIAAIAGQTQAYAGVAQLDEENKKFAAESILDEKERAAKLLEIDADMWRQRIQLAGDGTEAQKQLQQRFDTWYQNQLLKPQIDRNKKMVEQLDADFHDGIVNAFQGGENPGKAFVKSIAHTLEASLADVLYQTFARQYVVQIAAAVSGIFNGGITGSDGTAAASSLGTGVNAIGTASTLSSAYTAMTSGFTAFTTTMGNAINTLGLKLGSTTITDFGAGMASGLAPSEVGGAGTAAGQGAGFGSGATVAAGAAAGYFGGKLISGQYGTSGTVAATTAVGAAVGSIVPGLGTALGAFVGGIVGGVYNRLFGMGDKNVHQSGITGKFSSTDVFSGQAFADWIQKGGLFRSDKSGRDLTDLDPATAKQLSDAYSVVTTSTKIYTDALGLSADKIKDYSQDIEIKLTGDASTDTATINEMFLEISNGITKYVVPGITDYSKAGEEASATLARLATNISGVNGIFTTLGLKLYDASLKGAGMASDFVDLFTSIDELQTVSATYYEKFYSEQERADAAMRSLNKSLADLGASGISTDKQLRDLIAAQDLQTDAGRKTAAALLKLAPTFDEVTKAATAAAKTANDTAVSAASAAYDALKKSVEASRSALTTTYQATADRLTALKDSATASASNNDALLNSLQSTLKSMSSSMDSQAATSRASAQAQIAAALAIANAGGPLPTSDSLSDALNVVSQQSDQLFSSSVDYQRDFLETANNIADLGKLAGAQKSVAEKSLDALNDQLAQNETAYNAQIAYYDQVLADGQRQIDALNGVSTNVLSLSDAMKQFAAAVLAAKTQVTSSTGAAASPASALEVLYQDLLGRGSDANGLSFYQNQLTSGITIDQIRQEIQSSPEYLAVHGSHAAGLVSVPYDGYIAETHVGEAIIDAASMSAIRRYFGSAPRVGTGSGGNNNSNAEVVAELRALKQEVVRLQNLQSQGNDGTRDVNKTLRGPILVEVTGVDDDVLMRTKAVPA